MRTRWGFIFSVRCVLHRLLRSENPPGLGFGIGYVLHRCRPAGALFFPSVVFYTDCFAVRTLRGWVLVLATFYTDITPPGLGFGIGYVLHSRPPGLYFFRPLRSTQMSPRRGSIYTSHACLHRCHPSGVGLWYWLRSTQMSPLWGWALVLAMFYTDAAPPGLYFSVRCVLHRCRPSSR